jgi:hypothetical protein
MLAFAVVLLVPPLARAGADDGPANATSRLTAAGDFNRDGIADLAQVTFPGGDASAPVLTVSLGQAAGGLKPVGTHPALDRTPRAMVAGDFNSDGIPDLIVGDEDGSLVLFLGDGTGRMLPSGNAARAGSVVSIAVADFNRDGIPDLAVSDWRSSSVTVLFGAGNGSFRPAGAFPLRMPGSFPHLTAADFNGDGIPDLAVIYGEEDDGYTYDVMLGDGKGAFANDPKLSVVKDPNAHCVT